jgi:hypothetical protein
MGRKRGDRGGIGTERKRCSPPLLTKMSLVTPDGMRNKARMPSDVLALFLLAVSSGAVTIAVLVYVGFPRLETRFTLVVTLLLVCAVLTLAPLVFLSHPMPR